MFTRSNRQLPVLLCALIEFTLCSCSNPEPEQLPVPEPAVDALPGVAVIGPVIYPFGTDATHPVLRNKKGDLGNTRSLKITVSPGDGVVIQPSCLFRERRKAPDPKVIRVDNTVCTKTEDQCVANEPVLEHRCEDKCHACIKCQPFPPSCYPWRCCDSVCQDVSVGTKCTRTEQRCAQNENHWKELTTYSDLTAPEIVKDLVPMTQTPLLLSGLKLKFSFTDSGGHAQEVSCALSAFKPITDLEKVSLHLSNVEACPHVFQEGAKSPVSLSFVNEMGSPFKYLQGNSVKTWDGRMLEQPQESVYFPTIDFAGTLTVLPHDLRAQ